MGWKPIQEDIVLGNGDWIYERTNKNGFPPDTAGEVRWANGVIWPAVVDGNKIRWRVEKANCTKAIIPDRTPHEMHIYYPNPEAADGLDDYPWKQGYAQRTELPEGDL